LSASPPAVSSTGGLGKKGRFAKVSEQVSAKRGPFSVSKIKCG